MRECFRKLYQLMSPSDRKDFWRLPFIMIFSGILQVGGIALVIPFMAVVVNPEVIQTNAYLSWAYQTLGFSSHKTFFVFLGVGVFAGLVLSNAFIGLAQWFSVRFSNQFHRSLSTRLMNKYLKQPYAFFLNKNQANLSSNLISESEFVTHFSLSPAVALLSKTSTSILIITLLVLINPFIALAAFSIFTLAYFLIGFGSRKKLRKVSEMLSVSRKRCHQLVNEVFHGIKDVKVLDKEAVYVNDYSQALTLMTKGYTIESIIRFIPKYLLEVLIFGCMVLGVTILFFLDYKADYLVPALSMYAFAGYRLMPALQGVFESYTQIKASQKNLDELHRDYFDEKFIHQEEEIGVVERTQLTLSKQLVFTNIAFSYPESTYHAIKNINLEIRPGTITAIVGPTGAGKSTIMDLLLGLLQPTEGQISLDNQLLNSENSKNWQQCVGYVPQSTYLCNGSVAENIAFGIPLEKINMERVEEVGRIAACEPFVKKDLSHGYFTRIGDNGVRLSGGQRQRISIARALYRDPSVLVLDEATSALDTLTEQEIISTLHTEAQSKTIILITHRISSVVRADQIYLVNDGMIVDSGDYQNLVKTSRLFRNMSETIVSSRPEVQEIVNNQDKN